MDLYDLVSFLGWTGKYQLVIGNISPVSVWTVNHKTSFLGFMACIKRKSIDNIIWIWMVMPSVVTLGWYYLRNSFEGLILDSDLPPVTHDTEKWNFIHSVISLITILLYIEPKYKKKIKTKKIRQKHSRHLIPWVKVNPPQNASRGQNPRGASWVKWGTLKH